MTGINMVLPPPTVIGIAVPEELQVQDGTLNNYNKLKNIKGQAMEQDTFEANKVQKNKIIKSITIASAICLGLLGLKKLIKK